LNIKVLEGSNYANETLESGNYFDNFLSQVSKEEKGIAISTMKQEKNVAFEGMVELEHPNDYNILLKGLNIFLKQESKKIVTLSITTPPNALEKEVGFMISISVNESIRRDSCSSTDSNCESMNILRDGIQKGYVLMLGKVIKPPKITCLSSLVDQVHGLEVILLAIKHDQQPIQRFKIGFQNRSNLEVVLKLNLLEYGNKDEEHKNEIKTEKKKANHIEFVLPVKELKISPNSVGNIFLVLKKTKVNSNALTNKTPPQEETENQARDPEEPQQAKQITEKSIPTTQFQPNRAINMLEVNLMNSTQKYYYILNAQVIQ